MFFFCSSVLHFLRQTHSFTHAHRLASKRSGVEHGSCAMRCCVVMHRTQPNNQQWAVLRLFTKMPIHFRLICCFAHKKWHYVVCICFFVVVVVVGCSRFLVTLLVNFLHMSRVCIGMRLCASAWVSSHFSHIVSFCRLCHTRLWPIVVVPFLHDHTTYNIISFTSFELSSIYLFFLFRCVISLSWPLNKINSMIIRCGHQLFFRLFWWLPVVVVVVVSPSSSVLQQC